MKLRLEQDKWVLRGAGQDKLGGAMACPTMSAWLEKQLTPMEKSIAGIWPNSDAGTLARQHSSKTKLKRIAGIQQLIELDKK